MDCKKGERFMCVLIQKTDDDSINEASNTQDSGLGILPINAENTETEEPDSSDPVIIDDAKPDTPPDTVAEDEKIEAPPDLVTVDEKTEEPSPPDTVTADPHTGILQMEDRTFWTEDVEVPSVDSESRKIPVYTDGTAQINVGKVNIYMRGKVALEGGLNAIRGLDAIKYRIVKLQSQLKHMGTTQRELEQCKQNIKKINKQIEAMNKREEMIRERIAELNNKKTLSESESVELKRLTVRLGTILSDIENSIANREQLSGKIEQLNREIQCYDTIKKELDQLRSKLHNYERSQDMNNQLIAAGFPDNEKANKTIVENLLKAAQRISEDDVEKLLKAAQQIPGDEMSERGIRVQSEITGTSGVTIILESIWRIYKDKDNNIKKYMTTVILKTPKEKKKNG